MFDVEIYGKERLITKTIEISTRIAGHNLSQEELGGISDYLKTLDSQTIKNIAIKARDMTAIDEYPRLDESDINQIIKDPKNLLDEFVKVLDKTFDENEQKYYRHVIRQDLNRYIDYWVGEDRTEMVRRVAMVQQALTDKGESFVSELAKAIEHGYETDSIKRFKKVPKAAYGNPEKLSEYFDEYLKKVRPNVSEKTVEQNQTDKFYPDDPIDKSRIKKQDVPVNIKNQTIEI
jgi:hypothetical protein